MSVTRAFFYVFSRVPSRGSLLSGSPGRAPIERERERERVRKRENRFENDKAKRHINTRATYI